jgi:hypothetical protein
LGEATGAGRTAFAGEGVGGAAGWSGDALPSRRGGNWDALSSGRRVGGSRRRAGSDGRNEGAELAGGEGFEGAEAGFEFEGGEGAFAVEPAEEIADGTFALLGVALDAGRDEVAVGIAAEAGARDDVVEALLGLGEAAQTVKAAAALAGVDGLAESPGLQEVDAVEVERAGLRAAYRRRKRRRDGIACACATREGGWFAAGGNLGGQEHFDEVAVTIALNKAQSAQCQEATEGFAGRSGGEADAAGEPPNGKVEAGFSFEAGVAQEIGIDRAVEYGQAQPWDKRVFHLLPDFGSVVGRAGGGVGHFVWHFVGHVIFLERRVGGR